MLPGPIFNVELLTSARRTRYFMVRAIYALVLLVALGLVYQSWAISLSYRDGGPDIHSIADLSAAFFGVFSVIQLLAVTALGPALVAGTIATERERRTIEYLFASSLSNAEIVLGKLAARLVHVVYLVLAGVPILALMMLLGGIAPEALLSLTIITLVTVLAVSTLSIAISVWSPRARDAVTRSYLVLFVLLVIPLMVSSLPPSEFYRVIEPVNRQFMAANPFMVLTPIITASSGSTIAQGFASDMLFASIRNNLIFSCVLACAATLAVRRTHLRQRGKAARRRKWRLLHLIRPSVGRHPMLWKELFAEPAASRLGWAGRIAMTLIVLAVIALAVYVFFTAATSTFRYRAPGEQYAEFSMVVGSILGCLGLMMVAGRAAGSITSERERDCWTSLLSTPLEPTEIVWAKIAGSVWSLRGMVLLLLFVWGLGVLLDPKFLIAVPFLLGTFLLLAVYAAALGVRYSLWCRNSLRSMAATLATGLFAGGIYMFCCAPVLVIIRSREAVRLSILILAPCVPFLLALPSNVYVMGEHFARNDEGGMLVFAYLLGVGGYLTTAVVLASSAIARFDVLSGRSHPKYWSLKRPPPQETAAEAIVVATAPSTTPFQGVPPATPAAEDRPYGGVQ
jgi:ABC-type transport system involved in multi-copper enzyme maturation permease subunit